MALQHEFVFVSNEKKGWIL
ncbi:Protein of unknown function [Bacillus wiedmannii]|nr:Protein of unknown function [Bacillus wiedmannii]